MSTPTVPSIELPDLDWIEGRDPQSKRFGDIYFSTANGLAESRHVFLDGIGAPEIWSGRAVFSIGETGFGTGLNFLNTWKQWEQTAPSDAILSYTAIEGFPLSVDDLARALGAFPELENYARQLIDLYPSPHPGFHQITLGGGRIKLLLLFGNVAEMLSSLVGEMDAWYLDGFAPAKNPDMWTDQVLAAIAGRSRPGARLATFTAAGNVRRSLEALGFEIEKVAGYGRKRECLRGVMATSKSQPNLAPWYQMPKPMAPNIRIAIIGAGVAGGAMAHALKSTSAEVTVYDRGDGPAAGASGNPLGLLQPRPADRRQPFARFQSEAYLHAIRVLDGFEDDSGIWKGQRGVISYARDQAFLERYIKWIERGTLPVDHAEVIDADQVEAISGTALGGPAVHFPHAGTIDPAAVCRSLLGQTPCRYGMHIDSLQNNKGLWQLIADDGTVLGEADVVVLASGVEAKKLSPECDLSLFAKRGQLSLVNPSDISRKLKVGLSYGGYATPALGDDALHVLGATYQRCPDWENLSWQELDNGDDDENIGLLSSRSETLADIFGEDVADNVAGGRASLRTTTEDHAPVIGSLFSDVSFRAVYGDLHHGKPARNYTSATDLDGPGGLYVLTAFGSRGFALATLAAEILVAQMFGLPIPVEKSVIEAIHPARFLVRALKRR
jgi:tRNA 5-methylaminomethyl-2-thiouridine biosynthesis bifunctional protein